MKKRLIILFATLMSVLALTGCEKKKEEAKIQATETFVEENEVQLVYHDTENVEFRIAVIEGKAESGLERLMNDAEKGEAANLYQFRKYSSFSNFDVFLKVGVIDIAVISLEDALKFEEEKPGTLCLLSINEKSEDGYVVAAVTKEFAKTYPLALQVFMEEMQYSAKDATCIVGDEMRLMIENYLIEAGKELPAEEFYYPLPETTVEEAAAND